MKNEDDSLSVVIPVYNEENCISQVISDWNSSLKALNISHTIIVVDDGSTDQTASILDELALKVPELQVIHQKNAGHGAAVKRGYIDSLHLSHNYVFQTDSDNQFTPEDFPKFWNNRKQSQALFGQRVNRKDPVLRKLISGHLRKTLFNLFGADIPDANIPYRLFHRDYLSQLLALIPAGVFAPNIFLSILSFAHLKTPKVFPVQHFERKGDSAKLIRWGLVKACFKSFYEIFSFSYLIEQKVQFLEETLPVHRPTPTPTYSVEDYAKVA